MFLAGQYCPYCVKFTKFAQLTLTKITKFVAKNFKTKKHQIRFRTPLGELTAFPQTPSWWGEKLAAPSPRIPPPPLLSALWTSIRRSGSSLFTIRTLAYIIKGRQFRCSVTDAKRSFNRSTNAIFGKVGRISSEKVTLQLVKSKCLPILLYELECYSLLKADLHSLDFVVMRFLMKLF